MFVPGIRVQSNGAPFRRAGFAFGPEAVVLAVHMVSAGQVGALLAEPRLTVSLSEDGEHWLVPTAEQVSEFLTILAADGFKVAAPDNDAAALGAELTEQGKTEFQTPGGPEVDTGGDASPPAPSEGQASTGTDDTAADAVDPTGAGDTLAVPSEEFREGEVAASTSTDGVATSGKQPEDTTQPPVAKPATTRRPKKPAV